MLKGLKVQDVPRIVLKLCNIYIYVYNFFYYGILRIVFVLAIACTTNTRLLVAFADRITVCELLRLLSACANRLYFVYFILSLKRAKRQYVTRIAVYCRNTG